MYSWHLSNSLQSYNKVHFRPGINLKLELLVSSVRCLILEQNFQGKYQSHTFTVTTQSPGLLIIYKLVVGLNIPLTILTEHFQNLQ